MGPWFINNLDDFDSDLDEVEFQMLKRLSLSLLVPFTFGVACSGCTQSQNQISRSTSTVQDWTLNADLERERQIESLEASPEEQFEEANAYVQSSPDRGRAYAVRSMVQKRLGRIKEQIADLDAAINLLMKEPLQQELLFECIRTRGLVHQALENDDEAVADFTRVLAMNSDHFEVLQSRSISYMRLGRLTEAMTDIDLAISLAPQDPLGYYTRMLIRKEKGDHIEAERDHEMFLSLREDPQLKSLPPLMSHGGPSPK